MASGGVTIYLSVVDRARVEEFYTHNLGLFTRFYVTEDQTRIHNSELSLVIDLIDVDSELHQIRFGDTHHQISAFCLIYDDNLVIKDHLKEHRVSFKESRGMFGDIQFLQMLDPAGNRVTVGTAKILK